MLKGILNYSLMLGVIFALASCDKLIYDDKPGEEGAQHTVYLSINYGGSSKLRSTDLPGNPTINEDVTQYEDRVHDLAVLVFESGTGGSLLLKYMDPSIPNTTQNKSFVLKLTPGQRDFYFIANMPMTDLNAIATKAQMANYIANLNNLDSDLYKAATNDKGFPMSRIYLNQTISAGGTIYQPAPFKPDGEERVLLIRTVAKLEVKVPGDEADAVESITLKNAFSNFHFNHGNVVNEPSLGPVAQSTGIPHATISHHADVVLTKQALDVTTNTYSYIAYMPEALMNGALWGNVSHQPINYFVIKTTSGNEFEIPIITASNYTYAQNYLAFAKNNDNLEKYNIYRNRRYLYEVRNLSNIEIQYNIKEWTQVPVQLFMGYGYNVIIDESGKITIENTIDDCMPHKVKLEAKNGAHFGGGASDTTKIYGYSSKTDPGYDEQKAKAGYSEEFGPIDTSSVSAGSVYLDIFYNDILVKTYTK